MAKITTRLGKLIRVKNIKTKVFTYECDTYITVWVKDLKGNNVPLLFRDTEIDRAKLRADKNVEDVVKRSWLSKLID